jgi:hypothetical protein
LSFIKWKKSGKQEEVNKNKKRGKKMLAAEFIVEVPKKFLNLNHLFVTHSSPTMRVVFVWIQIDQNIERLKAQRLLNLQVVQKLKSFENSTLKTKSFMGMIQEYSEYRLFLKSLLDFERDIGAKIFLLLDRVTWHK